MYKMLHDFALQFFCLLKSSLLPIRHRGLLIIFVSCHLFPEPNNVNNYACLLEFFVFRKQCIREAVSEMQPLPGRQPKRGRRLKIKLEKLQVILASFVRAGPTEVKQIDLLLVRARSGNFTSICLSFLNSLHYFLCWAPEIYFLELFAWFLIDNAQHIELEKLVTAELRLKFFGL